MELVFDAEVLKHKYASKQDASVCIENFYLAKNETVVLRGRSGSGKSTLLKLIAGALPPTDSKIKINSKSALIFQDFRLVAEATVLENVASGSVAKNSFYSIRFSVTEINKAKKLIEKIGLGQHQNELVSTLSGGQKQRVAIARALMSEPDILLADECFSQLDQATAIEVFNLIKDLQSEFKFCFLVSMHESFLSTEHFDREIAIPDPIKVNSARKADHTNFIFLFILIAFVFSFYSLNLSGLNLNQFFSQIFDLFLRFLPLQKTDWLGFSWHQTLKSCLVTIQIAFLGTVIGSLISLPLAVLAANNIFPSYVNKPVRFFLMSVRSIPALIWALIFVAAVGIGAVAGVLSLSVYSVGYLSKLFYEGFEDIEQSAYLSLKQLRASTIQAFRLSLSYKAKPMIISNIVFVLEYNIRAASLLGIVGAGGIGQELMYAIEWRKFEYAGIILILLLIIVFVADFVSEKIRKQIKSSREI